MKPLSLKCLAGVLGLALAGPAMADAASEAQASCGQCHALEAPDYAALGVAERLERLAPPLYFAGNKYREGWLESWLQNPEPIYAAGYFPGNAAIKSTPQGDVPDPEALYRHEPLDADQAAEIAGWLMSLRPHDELLAAAPYEEGRTALRLATMDFRKFKGCNSCHQDAAGEGGFSGPILYGAWQRLQPDYMTSFISDPTAWDPNAIMPRLEMNAAAVSKLVDYLRLIGGEE